eukprot:TRINITY_DN6690_c0_g1_i1.p1 TRINITY_DN6690_c0_g1~~TRINITY_DN6690_c0_g1_i1.p1  ORF type:complete len:279 (-),score=76.36 TRINITY_DN6690_c0_g1_i1:22-771(-)
MDTNKNKFHIFPTKEIGPELTKFVSEISEKSIKERGKFFIALSGGSLPVILGQGLNEENTINNIDWKNWHVFLVDERKVSKTHQDSNYNAVKKNIFTEKTNHPESQLYGIKDELELSKCAEDYQTNLRNVFGVNEAIPSFDLILLGMGPDGHTASLFPNHKLLEEQNSLIAYLNDSPKPPPERITFTLPLINNSRHVAFVATGAEKKTPFQKAIEIPSKDIPSSLISSKDTEHGVVHWFIDPSVLGSNY